MTRRKVRLRLLKMRIQESQEDSLEKGVAIIGRKASGGASIVRLPVEGMPPDAVPLMIEYLSGQIGTMDFATRAEAIRLQDSIGQAPRPER